MPDLGRVGGVTEFMRVGHMAQAWDLPVSPHLYSEPSLQLCGALRNCDLLEYMPWSALLFSETIAFREGLAEIPDRPGLGFSFDLDALDRYRVGPAADSAAEAAPKRPSRRAAAKKDEAKAKPGPRAAPKAESKAPPKPKAAPEPAPKPARRERREPGKTPWYLRREREDA